MVNPPSVKVIQVIRVMFPVGKGTDDDPIRTAIAIYDMNGTVLAVEDPGAPPDAEITTWTALTARPNRGEA